MVTKQNNDLYFDVVIAEGLYSTRSNLKYEMDTLFKGIHFHNKQVLDIGGGTGLYSFYAAFMGAKKVVCLEPETAGSSAAMIEKFSRLKASLKVANVSLEQVTFQDFNGTENNYDIILLHNSVNHLDEEACINLLEDPNAQATYEAIFSKIYSLANKDAKLIISDCSRDNFFATIKIRNPFMPTIEWHKHHAPEVWMKSLYRVGFTNPETRWLSFNTFRNWGKFLLGNRLMAHFTTSYFCLTMVKP
jgi:SAM-dependent methyltransferase